MPARHRTGVAGTAASMATASRLTQGIAIGCGIGRQRAGGGQQEVLHPVPTSAAARLMLTFGGGFAG